MPWVAVERYELKFILGIKKHAVGYLKFRQILLVMSGTTVIRETSYQYLFVQ